MEFFLSITCRLHSQNLVPDRDAVLLLVHGPVFSFGVLILLRLIVCWSVKYISCKVWYTVYCLVMGAVSIFTALCCGCVCVC